MVQTPYSVDRSGPQRSLDQARPLFIITLAFAGAAHPQPARALNVGRHRRFVSATSWQSTLNLLHKASSPISSTKFVGTRAEGVFTDLCQCIREENVGRLSPRQFTRVFAWKPVNPGSRRRSFLRTYGQTPQAIRNASHPLATI
jgi:hypothetical protein